MARPPSVPESLIAPMLQLWENGSNGEDLVAWLKEKHNITATVNLVNARLRKYKNIEQQARKDAIAERAGKQAIDYVAMIDKKIAKLDQITDKLLSNDANKEDLSLGKQMLDIQLKYIDKQMNLTGMDKVDPNDLDHDLITQGLIDKLGNDDSN